MGSAYNEGIHRRRSIRLRGYDYSSAGAYFVTVCTKNNKCLFGDIMDGAMELNEAGKIIHTVWDELPLHYPGIDMDAFVIMPNHIHGIIVLNDTTTVGAGLKPAPTPASEKRHALTEIVRGFKTFSSRKINQWRGTPGVSVWQRNYYEHIIRNETSLNRIREYIVGNPQNWIMDPENPTHGPVPYDFETELG